MIRFARPLKFCMRSVSVHAKIYKMGTENVPRRRDHAYANRMPISSSTDLGNVRHAAELLSDRFLGGDTGCHCIQFLEARRCRQRRAARPSGTFSPAPRPPSGPTYSGTPTKGRIRGFCSDRRDPIIAPMRVGAPMNALSRTIIHAFITS